MKNFLSQKSIFRIAAITSAFIFFSLSNANDSNSIAVTFKPLMVGDNLVVELVNVNDAAVALPESVAHFYKSLLNAKFIQTESVTPIEVIPDPQNKFKIIFKSSVAPHKLAHTSIVNCLDAWFGKLEGEEKIYLKEALSGTERRTSDFDNFSQQFFDYSTSQFAQCEEVVPNSLNNGNRWFLQQYIEKKLANDQIPLNLQGYDKIISKSADFIIQKKLTDNQNNLFNEVKNWFSRVQKIGFPIDSSIQFKEILKQIEQSKPTQKSWLVAEILSLTTSAEQVKIAFESKDFSSIDNLLYLADQMLEGCSNSLGKIDISLCTAIDSNSRFFWIEIRRQQGSFKIPIVK